MGRKGSTGGSGKKIQSQSQTRPKSVRRLTAGGPTAWLFGAAALALALIGGFRRLQAPPEDSEPQLDPFILSAKKHFSEGRIAAGIDDLVSAQKRDITSPEPAQLLDTQREKFTGPNAPRHLKSAVKQGMQRLEMVLYEEIHASNQLEDSEQLLQLAKYQLLFHPLDKPQEASSMLQSAQQTLSSIATTLKTAVSRRHARECSALAQRMVAISQERTRLSADILVEKKTPSAIASELLPSPLFTSVDRRAGLTLKEYQEDYLEKRRPVIITDYAERILGGQSWGWQEMKDACGEMEVILSERSSEARHLWAGLGHSGKNISLGEWIQSVQDGTAPREAYLMDWGLVGRCNSFIDKFVMPKYFAGDLWKTLPFNSSGDARDFFARHPSVFVGPAGSGGALHVDSYASTFWQVLLKGQKRWTLYALPDQLRRTLLYAGVEHEIMPLTPSAGEKIDVDRLPLLAIAEEFKVVVDVSEGELLVVPYDIPHMVENIKDVLAISMNVLDNVALPRVVEDLHDRACFSDNEAIVANLKVLESHRKSAVVTSLREDKDVPFSNLRQY